MWADVFVSFGHSHHCRVCARMWSIVCMEQILVIWFICTQLLCQCRRERLKQHTAKYSQNTYTLHTKTQTTAEPKEKKSSSTSAMAVCDRIRHARLLFQLFDTSSEVFSNSIFGRTVEKHTAHALHLEFRAFRIGRFKGSICARARASVQKFNRCSANEKCFLLFVVPPSNADFTTNAEHV